MRQGKNHANADALSRLPSDTCAGKRCICAGVRDLEQSGDYQDDYVTQARIDTAYVRHNSAYGTYSSDSDSSDDEESENDRKNRLSQALTRRMEQDQRAGEVELEDAFPDRSDVAVTNKKPTPSCQANAATGSQRGPADDLLAFTEAWSADAMARAQRTDVDIGPIYRAKQADDKRPIEAISSGF